MYSTTKHFLLYRVDKKIINKVMNYLTEDGGGGDDVSAAFAASEDDVRLLRMSERGRHSRWPRRTSTRIDSTSQHLPTTS